MIELPGNLSRCVVTACVAVALIGCNRSNVPERGTRLAALARSARLKGQSTADLPCPSAQVMTLGDLAQATKYATVALVEPVAQVVSPNGGDDVRTWFKFRILEMLRERRTAGMPLAGAPAELTPLAPNEFVTWYCGGTATINGVQITEVGATPADFRRGHAYLMWFELTRAGFGAIGWRDEGVFVTDGDRIRPVTAESANSQFDRELLQKVGNTITDIRKYLAAHP
jgi:hypothetical protein